MTDAVLFGEREGWTLSNFAAFAIEWRGRLYPTSEHAYQAEKFHDEAIREMIREARSAHVAKKLAHTHKSAYHLDWYDVRLAIMERIVRAKLWQHPYVARKLRETGQRALVENAPWDSFWGNGPDGKGENHLGRILEKLRAELRSTPQT